MAKIYKSGEWAKNGRVMPGKRTKETPINQLLSDGTVIDSPDQKFSPKKIKEILSTLFPDAEEKNGRIFLTSRSKNGKSLSFYTRNIYHLGGNWSPEKKRIEIGKDFLDFYENNIRNNTESILLGFYHYYPNGNDGVELFVCFSSKTYATRKVNNSAAHIHTLDLQNALRYGLYRRLDKSNNELLVFDKNHFVTYVNELRNGNELEIIKNDKQLLDYFGRIYSSLPKTLYGIDCYQEMFAAHDSNRNQNQWEGFYMEYYVKKYLDAHPTDAIEWWSKKTDDALDFDLRFHTKENFYGDVKSDNIKNAVQGNKRNNIDILIKERNGRLWYIVFEFIPERDINHHKQVTLWWLAHKDNKPKQGHDPMKILPRMKYSITIQNMCIYEINQFTFKYIGETEATPINGTKREKYQIPNKMKEFLRIYQCN